MVTKARDGVRLPKRVEADARATRVMAALAKTKLIWSGGDLRVPVVELSKALRTALAGARAAGRITRGLELTERKLSAESRGLDRVDRRAGMAARGQRISRLILVARHRGPAGL
jgi:hypothetical protein